MTIFFSSGLAFLLGLAYWLVIRFLLRHWEALPSHQIPADFQARTRVSILIPARNEAANIATCLRTLQAQIYPTALVEILLIDDHSTDDTAEIARQMALPNLRVLPVADGIGGKKAALTYGIGQASGELILTTDADCEVPADWLAQHVSVYQQQATAFVTAPVVLTAGPSALERFQALDMLGTMLITGAGIQSRTILMSNGANLAYPRTVFAQVGGFAGIDRLASGDDMLLMHKIARAYPDGIGFIKNRAAAVYTPAVSNWRAFFQQRLRWATKSGTYQDWRIIAVLALVFFLCWGIILSPLLAVFWGWTGLLPFIILFGFKVVADYQLLGRATRFFHQAELLRYFWPSQFLHILYIALIGLLANIFREYEWKGRRVQ